MLKGCNLDDQGMIGIADDDIQSRQADYFMKLIASFVYSAVTRHERAHFGAFFLKPGGQVPAENTKGSPLLNYKNKYTTF